MPLIESRQPVPGSDGWDWPRGLHPVLRQVLCRRALSSTRELELALGGLTPVGRFESLDAGVQLLLRHRAGRIVVVGDFDADGASSTALAVLCLKALGFPDVDFVIPDRVAHGYGLTVGLLERISERGPSLILTVDNGISSVAGVRAARELGMEVLITDHHLPPLQLPDAQVIINPNLRGDPFPGKHLAGVGVIFYLLAALGRALGDPTRVARYLDLVALGTVADLVPLDHGNRILVSQGLARIRAGQCRPGIEALCEVAGVKPGAICETDLAYQIGPRINAAGRIDDMTIGVRCLTTASPQEARDLAARLDGLNRERREMEARMRAEAAELVDAEHLIDGGALPHVVCLYREGWHEGLVGLVAAKIRERYHRPTIAFAPGGSGGLKGSGRSVAGFHLRDALVDVDTQCPGLIERFGGHAMAAGLTLRFDALTAFQEAMERVGRERLAPEHLAQRILTDGELAPEHLTLETATLLRTCGPWGQGFPEPCFEGAFELAGARMLKDAHLKLVLRPRGGRGVVDAIAFNRADEAWPCGSELRVVYRLGVNDYFGTPKLQLIVEHLEAV